jgi:hypothetical protein
LPPEPVPSAYTCAPIWFTNVRCAFLIFEESSLMTAWRPELRICSRPEIDTAHDACFQSNTAASMMSLTEMSSVSYPL